MFVQRDIVEINEIFRDLGNLVHEQGTLVGKFLNWLSPVHTQTVCWFVGVLVILLL